MSESADLTRLRTEYANRHQRLAGNDLYSFFNPSYLFMIHQRQRMVLRLLRRHGFVNLAETRILEIGCGSGGVLAEFLSYGARPANLYGLDLLPDRIRNARLLLPSASLAVADAQHIPYPEGSFDLVLQYTAFSSVLDDAVKANMACEMLRVLRRPGGMILWYDFWINPTNKQTRGIRPSEIRRLFTGCWCEFHRITLAPPLTRRLIPISWMLALMLEKCWIFNSHYLAAIGPEK